MKKRNPIRWLIYHRCLLPDSGCSDPVRCTPREAQELMRRHGCWMLRTTCDFDGCGVQPGWFVVKEYFGGMEELSASTRSKVRRSLRRCVIRREPDEEEPDIEVWGVYRICDGIRIGFARNRIYRREVFYEFFRAEADSLRGFYPYYGLLYTMNRHYLAERGMQRVSDGFRTMRERSGVQDFLEQRFRFRKAYVRTALYYRPWFGALVRLFALFPGSPPFSPLRALLRQHTLFYKHRL